MAALGATSWMPALQGSQQWWRHIASSRVTGVGFAAAWHKEAAAGHSAQGEQRSNVLLASASPWATALPSHLFTRIHVRLAIALIQQAGAIQSNQQATVPHLFTRMSSLPLHQSIKQM